MNRGTSLQVFGLFRAAALACLFFILATSTSCVYFNTFYNAKKHYRTAERENEGLEEGQFRPQNYQKTIDTAAKIPELYPDSKYVDDALVLMGKSYYRMKQYPKAQRKFEELLSNYPESNQAEEARLFLGKSLIENRDYSRARDILTSLSTSSDRVIITREAKLALGRLLTLEEKYSQAVEVYTKLAESESDKELKARAYFQAGENLLEKQDYASAVEAFRQSAEYNKGPKKQRFEARLNWAVSLRRIGKLEEASEVLKSVLKRQKLYQYFPRANVELAEIELIQGEVEPAVEKLDKIVQSSPRTEEAARAHYNLGLIYRDRLWDYEKSNEHLQQAPSQKPDSPYADSANVALNILNDWRGITNGIDSLMKSIEKDLKFLSGETDTISAEGDSARKSKVLELFDDGSGEPPAPETGGEAAALAQPEKELSFDEDELGEGRKPVTPLDRSPDALSVVEPDIEPAGEDEIDEGEVLMLPDSLQPPPDSAITAGDSIPAKQTVVDTAEVLQRMDDNRGKIKHLKYQLAEIYYFQLNNPDTSASILNFLADSAEADLASKSLFLLAHIERMRGDSAANDSIQRVLVDRYSETEYAQSARKRLGLPQLGEEADLGEQYFKKAERVLYGDNDPESAFELYALVDSLYPGSAYAPRSLYARAWIAQKEFYRDSLALSLLDTLKSRYPEDTLAVIAQRKTKLVEMTQPAAAEPEVDTTQTARAGEKVYLPDEVDELPVCAMDSSQITAYIVENRYYPPTAMMAGKNGLAILSLVVDKYGYPYDFQVVKDIPPGYGFGEAAMDVARNLEYTPGKLRGVPVPVRIEQRIRFEP